MLIPDVEVIWQCPSPKQSRPCYVISNKTNESLMVRDIDSITSVLMRKFAHEEARDFRDEEWLQKIFEGTKKRTEYCKDTLQGHSGGMPIEPELMGFVFHPQLEKVRLSWRTFMELPVHIGTGSRRKGERSSPSSSLSNTNESFWK